MTINEIHEYYSGEYIKGIGIPTIIFIGVEDSDTFRCQRFIIIENPKNEKFETSLSNIVTIKKDCLKDDFNLSMFVNDFGIEQSKNDLYYKALEINNYETIPEFHISKNSEASILMFLKRRSFESLNYIIENSISNQFKTIVLLYKRLNIEIRKL